MSSELNCFVGRRKNPKIFTPLARGLTSQPWSKMFQGNVVGASVFWGY